MTEKRQLNSHEESILSHMKKSGISDELIADARARMEASDKPEKPIIGWYVVLAILIIIFLFTICDYLGDSTPTDRPMTQSEKATEYRIEQIEKRIERRNREAEEREREDARRYDQEHGND